MEPLSPAYFELAVLNDPRRSSLPDAKVEVNLSIRSRRFVKASLFQGITLNLQPERLIA
jgi:hypothetical protein